MSNVAAANINVAEMMSYGEIQEAVEELKATLESNPAVGQMIDAAQSLEEMYESMKDYIGMKLEDFKVVFHKAVAFVTGPKTKLEDDMMESVAGGSTYLKDYRDFKKSAKGTIQNTIIAVALVVGLMVLGSSVGASLGSKLC